MTDQFQSKTPTQSSIPALLDTVAQPQQAELGNTMRLAWIETLSAMSSGTVGFVAARIREDLKTQHDILHC